MTRTLLILGAGQYGSVAYEIANAMNCFEKIAFLDDNNEKALGKPVLSDEKNEKYTYVTIHGMEKSRQYVNNMSDKANNILSELNVIDNNAKESLINLITQLIDRDR